MIPRGMLMLIFILKVLIFINQVQGQRWETLAGLSVASPIDSERDCDRFKFLSNHQRKICKKYIDFMEAVREGTKEALSECRHQFRNKRWNCTFFDSKDLFGGLLKVGTKETAFVYSILAAGVTHSVARACSSGRLRKCGCDKTLNGQSEDGFEWSGCSDNVAYGSAFSLKLLDSREHLRKRSLLPRALMNLHNNNVGRKAVERHMKVQCKCHGVSGSCEVKTCWKTLPDFRVVGDDLRLRYDRSVEVAVQKLGSQTELVAVGNRGKESNVGIIEVNKRGEDDINKKKNRHKNKTNKKKVIMKGKRIKTDASKTSVFTDPDDITSAVTSPTTVATTPASFVLTTPTTSVHINSTISTPSERYTQLNNTTQTTRLTSLKTRRSAEEKSQRHPKQKRNKVWISHGREGISKRQDSGENWYNQKRNEHGVPSTESGKDQFGTRGGERKKGYEGNFEKYEGQVYSSHNQELARYPRKSVQSESGERRETSQLLQNRRLKDMQHRRHLQIKRERTLRRQREQEGEEEMGLSEATDQHHYNANYFGSEGISDRRVFWSDNDHFHSDHTRDYSTNNRHVLAASKFHRLNLPNQSEDSFDLRMVYIEVGPDYCQVDLQTGSLGTHGRLCNIDGIEGNCNTLCCGRGYTVRRTVVTERCNCRFHWCCEVKCQKCRREVMEYTCR